MSHNKNNRRKVLKTIVVSSGAVVASKGLSNEWVKPVVDSVVLPAHAETTDSELSQGGANTSDNGNKPAPITVSGYDTGASKPYTRDITVPAGITQVKITVVGAQGGGGGGGAEAKTYGSTGLPTGQGGGGGGGGASSVYIAGSLVAGAAGGTGGKGGDRKTVGGNGLKGSVSSTTINVSSGTIMTLAPGLGGFGGTGGQGSTTQSGTGPGGGGGLGSARGSNGQGGSYLTDSGGAGGAGGSSSATLLMTGATGLPTGCPPSGRNGSGNTNPSCGDGSGGAAGDNTTYAKGGIAGAAGTITLEWL